MIQVKSDNSAQWNQVLETVKKIRALKKYMRKGENEGESIVADIPSLQWAVRGGRTFGP